MIWIFKRETNNALCSAFVGETKECGEFAKHFLERRSKYKNQQRAANAHIDDMCSPAPAITPASLQGIANDGQEAKVGIIYFFLLLDNPISKAHIKCNVFFSLIDLGQGQKGEKKE